jgi:hypothetical protein
MHGSKLTSPTGLALRMSDKSGSVRGQDRVYSCSTAASQNVASCDYFLVEKALEAFVIFRGQCQDAPLAFKMFSVQAPLYHHLFVV